jgi:BNR repeat-like domain/BNR/Asp-box repeat
MRRLVVLLVLVLAAPAAAATIKGTLHGELLVGTPTSDTIIARGGNDFVQAAFGGVDTVDCGAGADVVSADVSDKVAANCETVSRRLSVDPYTNVDSQHETAVEPDSFSFGSTVVVAFQLGRRSSGASANIGTAVSTDGGRTWERGALPSVTTSSSPAGPETAASDPAVAYDALHGIWLVGMLTLEPNSSHVYVARSTDGAHWSGPVDLASGPLLDKDWVVCDNGAASPFRGRCYAEYTDDQKNATVSQFSTDGGLTWSAPVRASTVLVGTQPVVEADGTLVVVAGDYNGAAALTGSIVALRSTDGGATFTRAVVSNLHARDNNPLRAIALPSVDVDSAGKIYAIWHDCRFRNACSENDLIVSTSVDGGVTWADPVRVPIVASTSPVDVFIPGLAADPLQPGHLALVYASYNSSSCSAGTCTLGIGFTTSPDGGTTWSVPRRLNAQPFPTTWVPRAEGGRMIGDYFSVSYAGDRVVPVFALAAAPLNGRFREAIFAASLRASG